MQPAKEGPMPVFQIDSIVTDYRFFGDFFFFIFVINNMTPLVKTGIGLHRSK